MALLTPTSTLSSQQMTTMTAAQKAAMMEAIMKNLLATRQSTYTGTLR